MQSTFHNTSSQEQLPPRAAFLSGNNTEQQKIRCSSRGSSGLASQVTQAFKGEGKEHKQKTSGNCIVTFVLSATSLGQLLKQNQRTSNQT